MSTTATILEELKLHLSHAAECGEKLAAFEQTDPGHTGTQQPQHAITNRDCNAEMVGGEDADILGDDYEVGNK